MKKSLLILAFAGTMAVAQSAFALTVYDPTNHTENLATKLLTVYDPTNHTENLATKLQMIEQVKNSAQQLQNDIKNLQKLDPSELQLSLNYIQETIQDLNRLREQTDAIGTEYDQLMSEWDEANPDYEDWNGVDAEKYAEQTDKLRDKWSKALLQALTAQSIASPSEQLRTGDAMERLLNASQNADGAMGALQAANQLTGLMIAEQQKMQVIMADSMRSQNMYYQMIIDGEKQAKKINEEFVADSDKYEGAKITGSGGQVHQFKE